MPKGLILDPYCGTARLLLPFRKLSYDVAGVDCSPLALLAARVSHQQINLDMLLARRNQIVEEAKKSKIKPSMGDSEGFWFERKSYVEIVKLLEAIESCELPSNARRVFWLSLADCIRKVSYLRENEYKLHRMKADLRADWCPSAIDVFTQVSAQIIERLAILAQFRANGKYRFFLGDISEKNVAARIGKSVAAIVTSPPYGDSRSTVGYGQFARIPLMILKRSAFFAAEFPIDYTYDLDSSCLGGTRCKAAPPEHITSFAKGLPGGMGRFVADYFSRLNVLDSLLQSKGLMCFVLADRIHDGAKFPLVDLTSEFMARLGYKNPLRMERQLSLKRLPRSMRYRYQDTYKGHEAMNYETVLGFVKAS